MLLSTESPKGEIILWIYNESNYFGRESYVIKWECLEAAIKLWSYDENNFHPLELYGVNGYELKAQVKLWTQSFRINFEGMKRKLQADTQMRIIISLRNLNGMTGS